MRENADIITGTPGKLAELVESGKLNLSNVRLLVRPDGSVYFRTSMR
jgi:superfamily II DNA/RNA helicase